MYDDLNKAVSDSNLLGKLMQDFCCKYDFPMHYPVQVMMRRNVQLVEYYRDLYGWEKKIRENQQGLLVHTPPFCYARDVFSQEWANICQREYGDVERIWFLDRFMRDEVQYGRFLVEYKHDIFCDSKVNKNEDKIALSWGKHLRNAAGRGPQRIRVLQLNAHSNVFMFWGMLSEGQRSLVASGSQGAELVTAVISHCVKEALIHTLRQTGQQSECEVHVDCIGDRGIGLSVVTQQK